MIRIILSIGLRCPTCPLGADGGPRLLPHAMQSIPTVPSSLAPLPRGPGGPVQDGGEITQISERLSARWVHYLEIQRYLSSGHRCSVCGSSVLHPPPQAEYLPSRPPLPPTPLRFLQPAPPAPHAPGVTPHQHALYNNICLLVEDYSRVHPSLPKARYATEQVRPFWSLVGWSELGDAQPRRAYTSSRVRRSCCGALESAWSRRWGKLGVMPGEL